MKQPSPVGGLFSAHRICVTGANGAGKSYFSDILAEALDLPLFRNDGFTLTRNWECRAKDAIQAQLNALSLQDKWILEGGPSIVGPNGVADRADIIVWLDVPRLLRCYRIFRRTLRYVGTTRPDLPDGNPEHFDRRALRFALKAWQNHRHTRQVLLNATQGRTVLHLQTQSEVAAVVDLLRGLHTARQGAELF